MRNDQYFPHDATAGNNTKLMMLIESEGMRGYGVYWYLLEFLRQQAQYKGKLKMLDMLARRMKTKQAIVMRIITGYDLFAVDEAHFCSPGLIERMQPLDSKREAKSEQCRQAAGSKWLKTNKSVYAGAWQEEESNKEEKRISSFLHPSSGGEEKKEEEKKEDSPRASPAVAGRSEQRARTEDGGHSFISQVGVKTPPEYAYNRDTHNLEGLMRSLNSLGVWEAKEVNAILTLSDYGRLGGIVWKLLYHTKWEKIQQPGKFLIAGIKKESG